MSKQKTIKVTGYKQDTRTGEIVGEWAGRATYRDGIIDFGCGWAYNTDTFHEVERGICLHGGNTYEPAINLEQREAARLQAWLWDKCGAPYRGSK